MHAVSAPSAPATPALSPQQLAESFTSGMQTGGPISAGTEVLSHNAMNATFQPQVTHQPTFTPPPVADYSPATMPTAGTHFAYETVQPATETTSYTPPANSGATMYAAPVAPAAPIAPAGPPAPAGPLPSYGADLRPPTPTVAAPTLPPAPAAASPASALVNPSSGAGGLNQAVVRQQPTATSTPASQAGLTETAVAAAGAGAIAGAVSEEVAARTRLRRLLEAVARQEPKLRWAVGERDDGTTVLATDLACGWIPPSIEIPTGVTLLTPARRRGGLEALIGDTALVETWTPGRHLPAAKDVEQVSMSLRSRDLPAVDDLNWELSQATNWRDGLPRLAHTLAKAGFAGTGILDSEADLLREHLRAMSDSVLTAYPDSVDEMAVGNWQLLAAIDALVGGRSTTLNYHFAWFQALNTATRGGRQ